ncbi:MAG: methyltransferase [Clostridia bacterium]
MKWEPLGKNLKVLVSKEHTFNTDTLILAYFSKPSKNDICADFGTGCGTIALLWKYRVNPKQIYAVELQKDAYNQAKISIKENNFESLHLINNNINNYKDIFKHGSLSHIACNPPYKAVKSGIKNNIDNMRIARHEDELSLCELAKAVAYSLKFGGKFYICQRPERLTDVMTIFREKGIEPKKLQLVQQSTLKAPSLFLLECVRGGKSGLSIMPNLIIEENGKYTDKMTEIYGDYMEGRDD